MKESSYLGDVEQNWEGLDIRETDTLTSKCRISDVICFSLLECRVSVRDRVVLRKLYTIYCSVESVQLSLFFEVCSQFTVLWSLYTVRCLWSLQAAYRPWSRHTVYEGRMTKTSSKERGKGPGRGKGRPPGGQRETLKDRDNVPSKDGGSGSETERLRQRILETEGMNLSDVEASGSGRQEAETEDVNADEEDKI